ncbi:hypothetical protein HHK36_010598 [Tetracentron sinense]|uniref:Uncharacterized protein n=1 Tax=Tetracentron sinense TaxID=13715 RepID=A0A835DFF2_TETSI|nr:hypothetical protein HHK36_010598 [Tetracentron sinense]
MAVATQSRGACLVVRGAGGVGTEDKQSNDSKRKVEALEKGTRNLELHGKLKHKRIKQKKNEGRTIRRRNLRIWRRKASIEGYSITTGGDISQLSPLPFVENLTEAHADGSDLAEVSPVVGANPVFQPFLLAHSRPISTTLNPDSEEILVIGQSCGPHLPRDLSPTNGCLSMVDTGIDASEPFGLDSTIQKSEYKRKKGSGQGIEKGFEPASDQDPSLGPLGGLQGDKGAGGLLGIFGFQDVAILVWQDQGVGICLRSSLDSRKVPQDLRAEIRNSPHTGKAMNTDCSEQDEVPSSDTSLGFKDAADPEQIGSGSDTMHEAQVVSDPLVVKISVDAPHPHRGLMDLSELPAEGGLVFTYCCSAWSFSDIAIGFLIRKDWPMHGSGEGIGNSSVARPHIVGMMQVASALAVAVGTAQVGDARST